MGLLGLIIAAYLVTWAIRSAWKGGDDSKDAIEKIQHLATLSTLKENGTITTEEFEAQKKKLLKK